MPAHRLALALLFGGCAAARDAPPIAAPAPAVARELPPDDRTDAPTHLPGDHRVVARRRMRDAELVLTIDRERSGALFVIDGDRVHPIPCDRLPNAWGLWLDDVDDDGRAEAVVALRRPARFDPGEHHRLHVYAFDRGRCVPLWRGTRLAGRFDAATIEADRRGTLLVHEWTAPRSHRLARYRWSGFGYTLDAILWRGDAEAVPPELDHPLDHPFDPSPP